MALIFNFTKIVKFASFLLKFHEREMYLENENILWLYFIMKAGYIKSKIFTQYVALQSLFHISEHKHEVTSKCHSVTTKRHTFEIFLEQLGLIQQKFICKSGTPIPINYINFLYLNGFCLRNTAS